MKEFFRLLKIGGKYAMKCKALVFFYSFLLIMQTVLGLTAPMVDAELLNLIANSSDIERLKTMVIVFSAVHLLYIFFLRYGQYFWERVYLTIGYNMRKDIMVYVQATSLLYASSYDAAEISNKVGMAGNMVPIMFQVFAIRLPITLIGIGFSFYMVARIDLMVAVILVVLMVLYMINYKIFSEKRLEAQYAEMNTFSAYNSMSEKEFANVKFIGTHSAQSVYLKKMDDSFHAMIKSHNHSFGLQAFSIGVGETLSLIIQAVIYIVIGSQVILGNYNIAVFSMVLQYSAKCIEAVKSLYNVASTYPEAKADYKAVDEILAVYSHKDGEKMPEHIDNITVENLSFDYGDKPIYRNYNLELEKGKIYGLKGDNGAGKSTLLNIMLGLYMGDYTGEICYNGVDINDINLTKCKQKLIGVTEQEPLLMKDTLYNNICLTEKYSKEDIYKYAEMIGLKPYLDKLPEGLETEINDQSTNISGGEKQKISILRQLLKNPDVMIFDEPTSALDIESAKLFLQHIQKIKDDKIIIMISHDENAQKIYDETIYIKKVVPQGVNA